MAHRAYKRGQEAVSLATYGAMTFEDDGYIVKHWINVDGREVWSAWIYDDEDASDRVNAACAKFGADSPFSEVEP